MKYKLSKNQWEEIGTKAGWIKVSNRMNNMIMEVFWRIKRGEKKDVVLKQMGINEPSMLAQLDLLLERNPNMTEKDLPTAFKN